jgi:hypothetical protein
MKEYVVKSAVVIAVAGSMVVGPGFGTATNLVVGLL